MVVVGLNLYFGEYGFFGNEEVKEIIFVIEEV